MTVSADGFVAHGLNPSAVIADELHAWRTPKQVELWDALDTAIHKRPGAYWLVITTAGRGAHHRPPVRGDAGCSARRDAGAGKGRRVQRRPSFARYRSRRPMPTTRPSGAGEPPLARDRAGAAQATELALDVSEHVRAAAPERLGGARPRTLDPRAAPGATCTTRRAASSPVRPSRSAATARAPTTRRRSRGQAVPPTGASTLAAASSPYGLTFPTTSSTTGGSTTRRAGFPARACRALRRPRGRLRPPLHRAGDGDGRRRLGPAASFPSSRTPASTARRSPASSGRCSKASFATRATR